jgi:GT2 family glycosyltransferase/ADP-heptose:LPS heptosyltransferase/glycosyltransferase involved in cell wall biosynthesis/SAM-dependent methyltransferase
MPCKRLILIPGPLSLLNVLSLLHFQKFKGEYGICEDYLVVGDLGGDHNGNQQMLQICRQIAQAWSFKNIFYLKAGMPISSMSDFEKATAETKRQIRLPTADVVYTCRNWQYLNEVFLGAYPEARKICYGDGLGHLDLNTRIYGVPVNPSGFIPMDCAYLLTPNAIEKDAVFNCPIHLVEFDYFSGILNECSKKIEGLAAFCDSLVSRFGKAPTVITTSNLTESFKRDNVDDEIQEYLRCTLKLTQEGECIFIKGHPRQRLNQSGLLSAALCAHKRDAVADCEFSHVPLELFIPFLKIAKAITLNSSCCISLAYCLKSELYVGMGEETIRRFWPPQRQELGLMNEHLTSILVAQAYDRKFKPAWYFELPRPQKYHPAPIHMKWTDAGFKSADTISRKVGPAGQSSSVPESIRLYLGCGDKRKKGYINVDKYVSAPDVAVMDPLHLPYDNGVVDVILTEHMLEHLGKQEVPLALKEWARVLKPHGKLLMNLPNLEWCMQQWLAKPEKDRWGWQLDTIFGLQTHRGEFHQTGFTSARLHTLLKDAGFSEIRVTDIWSHGQSCFWIEALPQSTARFDEGFERDGDGWSMKSAKGHFSVASQKFGPDGRVSFDLRCCREGTYHSFPFQVLVSLNNQPMGVIPFSASWQGHTVELACDRLDADAEIRLEIGGLLRSGPAGFVATSQSGSLRLENVSVEAREGKRQHRFVCKASPIASIIIPVLNKVDYTRLCLAALDRHTPRGMYEIVLVDNGSSDETRELLNSLGTEVKVIRNPQNLGFAKACNQGGFLSRCKYLLFLNNDTEVTGGWFEHLLDEVEGDPLVGATGAKLVYPDGRLQEAGGIIFSDGKGWNFGNGDDAGKDIYNRRCEVDYCSGACLLVRREMFLKLGGLDERYSPAYYEETDLCFGLRKFGFKVTYRPDAVVIHHESATAGTGPSSFKRYLEINRRKFVEKWKNELTGQPPPPENETSAPLTSDRNRRSADPCGGVVAPIHVRQRKPIAGKMLVFFPHNPWPPKTGAHQRCLAMLKGFSSLGFDITLASSTQYSDSPWTPDSIASLQRDYGVHVHVYHPADSDLIVKRSPRYDTPSQIDWGLYTPLGLKEDFRRCFTQLDPDIVMISYAYWAGLVGGMEFSKALRLIDTHDLVTLNQNMRQHLCSRLSARSFSPEILAEHFFSEIETPGLTEECEIYDRFDYTIAISAADAQRIAENSHRTRIIHIPMTFTPVALKNTYSSAPIFVVGDNPFNLQAYYYFIAKVLPQIRKQEDKFVLKVGGYGSANWSPVDGVEILGPIADLPSLYADACFAVCPMIGTTGQQIKIVEAMAHGLPVVALRNAAMHSPIEHGVSGFIAEDAESFAGWTSFLYQRRDICREMGAHARETIRKNFSEGRLRSQLLDITSTRGRLKSERAADRLVRGITAATTRCQSPPERIVMLRTDAIGDTILAAGMIEPVRKKYPNAWLSVVCQEHVAEIYESCPYVDEVVGFNRGKLAKNDSYRQQLLNSLNRGVPTLLLNSVFSRDGIADWLAMGIQAPEKVAHWGDLCNISAELRLQNNHCYTRLVSERVDSASELQRHRDFLSACGIDATSLKPTLWLTQEDEIFADRFFVEKQLDASRTIALFIGAQHPIRIYPFYGKALSRVCKDEHLNVIAFGSSSETELNSTCLAEIGVNVINLCGKTSLRQTAALLKRCRLGVGAETGTAHMACAVGTPHVVVIGGGHFGRFMPYSPLTHLVCLPLECFGCNWRCRYPKPLCIWGVDPAVLEQAVGAALELNTTGPHVFIPRREDWNPPAGGPIWKWPPSINPAIKYMQISSDMI